MSENLEKKASGLERAQYFFASAGYSAIKSLSYAFTIPSSIRKAITKNDKCISHKQALIKYIGDTQKDTSLEKQVNSGDFTGFLTGTALAGFYAITSLEMMQHQGDSKMLLLWFMANGLSLGYELARLRKKV